MADGASLKDEIIRCGKDPQYFIDNYVKIQHPVRGLIPFKTFDYQKQLLQDYTKYRLNVILKARQLGISEVTAAYALWLMLFHRNKNILVMASKAETAKNIIKKVKTALAKLPNWLLMAEEITNNRLSVELSNGSQIKAIATSDDAGRSEAISLLVIDEAAFVKNFDTLWTGLYPTVSAGGKVIVLSTPCGVGNKFHEIYSQAEDGRNDFHPTKLMWWAHPERISDLRDDPIRPGFKTSSWFENEVKVTSMSPRDIAQELECNFNASGETYLSPEQIDWIREGTIDPILKKHWDRNLFVWWEPEKGKRYFITADVARGDGKDNSACSVWDSDTMEQCAEYYGKLSPEEYAYLLMDLGHAYNNALLVIENNNIGMACLEHIRLGGYENVYYSRKGDNSSGQAVNSSWGPAESDMVIGFTMSQKVRPLILAKLEEMVRNRTISIRSKRFMTEIETFIWDNSKPQAMKGYNDDAVMSVAFACWMKDTFISPGEQASASSAALINGMSLSGHKNTDIKGASKDPALVPYSNMGVFSSQNPVPTRLRLPNGQQIDLRWLYKG